MGEAKRRKAVLGDRYGKADTSKRELHRLRSKTDLPLPGNDKLMPDYGTYYVRTMGVTPLTVHIANPEVIIGEREANIGWNAGGYMATLIVTPEVGRAYLQNPTMLTIVPDPEDAYVTPLGERVVPFKLVTS